MADFSFVLSRTVARRGTVIFTVANEGTAPHDFRIAGKRTPVMNTGEQRTLRVIFKKRGRFPYVCTVPGHKEAGMKGVLVVR